MVTSRQAAVRVLAGAAALLTLVSCGGEDDPDPAPSGSPPATTEPALTAPPSLTPEEQAEADIQATFEQLIAAMDAFYSSASEYSVEEVSTSSPVVGWPVVGAAELELSNWLTTWRLSQVETEGASVVARHEIDVTGLLELPRATSVACRDLTSIEFRTYLGEPAVLPYEPNEYQIWEMTWTYEPEAAPEAGIETAGWYVDTIAVTTDRPC